MGSIVSSSVIVALFEPFAAREVEILMMGGKIFEKEREGNED
jgi:hypothetical protein